MVSWTEPAGNLAGNGRPDTVERHVEHPLEDGRPRRGRLARATGRQVLRIARVGGRQGYFLAENGKMTVVEDGPAFKVVAPNELGETCCASPAVSRGHLFLRTDKALSCIGK